MTPERLQQIRHDDARFGQIVSEPLIHRRELLAEVDRLRAQNADILSQINTDSDVMWGQRMEIEHIRAEREALEETR